MSKNLVIVESPAKGKTIEKFLGSDYKVVASYGHIRDLPEKNLGIDMDTFMPSYEISEDKKKNVDILKKLATTHPQIWIATDEDREGEAIGWHLCSILNLDPTNVKRIVFHEITKEAILNSIKTPRNIDINLVNAQQGRRILDRIVGYKVSPILWAKIKKGLSAGRVQSVAVKLIVEKEREIQNFKKEESWTISAILKYENKNFKIVLTKIDSKNKKFKSIEDVKKLFHILYDSFDIIENLDKKGNIELKITLPLEFKLNNTQTKEAKRSPQAPFTTSTLQQEASRKFGFGVKQTMMLAQKLYEGVDLGGGERVGLITYMRTDSVNLSQNAIGQASQVIKSMFGDDYLKTRRFKTKSASAQEAHEAIRPTYLSRSPESLKNILEAKELKLYTLIWKRTLASQMSDAIVEVTTLDFSPTGNQNQNWNTSGEVIKFDGFMKLYMESKDDEDDEDDEGLLPKINFGEKVKSIELNGNQVFSKPPSRYTEASLVKKLESEGIGRPSTYAPTISTIMDRGYVDKIDKKYLFPTDIAFIVNDFLNEYFKEMMNYSFTRSIEENFDEIATGKKGYEEVLSVFWNETLKKEIEIASKTAEKIVQKVGKTCSKCGGELIYKYSKTGKFIGCGNYPECDYIEKSEEENSQLDLLKGRYEGKPCPEGIPGTIVVKIGRFGPFLASSMYPDVKWIGKIKDEKEELLEEILREKGLLIDEETKEELVVKNSKRGPFLRAKNYPQVKIAKNIPKEIWEELKNRMGKIEKEKEIEENN